MPKDPLKQENTYTTVDAQISPWNNSQQAEITAFSVCKAVYTLYSLASLLLLDQKTHISDYNW